MLNCREAWTLGRPFRNMKQTVLIFSAIVISLLILLELRKWSLVSAHSHQELWTVVFACLFIGIGIFLTRYITPPKISAVSGTEMSEQEVYKQVEKIGLTPREYEILRLVGQGYSNQEISAKLYISESTVKTHVSNVLMKLDAKRRTQAVQKAKEMRIL